jgi:hypothetical protein
MKTTYRRLVRRRIEAALRLKVDRSGPIPTMDAPMELPPEVVDLATGTLKPQPSASAQRTWRRPQEDL